MVYITVDRFQLCLMVLLLLPQLPVNVICIVNPYTGNGATQKHDVTVDVISISETIGGIPTCYPGWTGDGYTCSDIDECDVGMDLCDANANCTNTLGGYECTCNNGWSGDGFECTDVDECLLSLDACHKNAVCTNSVGGYTCTCASGWTGDGFKCSVLEGIGE